MPELWQTIITNPVVQLAYRLCALFAILIWVSLIFWTYRDADRRGALPLYWAAVVFFFNFPGWIIYLIVRPPEYEEDVRERELEIQTKEALLSREQGFCPGCMKPVDGDFLICPYCMKKLKKPCPTCGRALQMSWTICPYCRANV